MKSKKIRLLTAVLAVSMACGTFLAGCNKSQQSDSQEPNTGTKESDSNFNAEGLPIVKEKVTLTALINVGNTMTKEPDEMESFKNFEKETNVDIKWEVVRSGWEERKTMLLASNDLPDMFWSNRSISMSDIMTNTESFVKLNDYIDKYGVNIKKMFADEPGMKKLSTLTDGSIYSLPHRMPLRPDTFDGTYINKKWLDKVGMGVPTTTDEFYKTLKAFKEQDPNGNGKQDEIPYCFPPGTGTMFGTWWLFGSFGLADNIWGEKIEVRNGELIFTPIEEGFKEGLKYLRKLYAEGLMDTESFTQDWSQYQAKATSSEPQLVGVSNMWTINTTFGNANAKDYVTLPPLKGPNGDQRWRSNPINLKSSPSTWELTKNCKNPEVAFRFIDYVYDPQNSVQLYFGSYGEGLKKNGDSLEILPSNDPKKTYDNWIWEVGFGDMGPYYVSHEFEQKIKPNEWVMEKKQTDDIYKPFLPEEVFPTMNYDKETSDELAVLRTDIDKIINDKFAAWVTGNGDIDKEWNDYVDQLKKVGLDRLMEIYKTAYANYIK